ISLTIATGGRGGVFYPLGVELSRLYTTGVPGVVARIESGGSSQNVKAVEEGRAHLGFTQADVAYAAYRRGTDGDPHPYGQLRGVAMLWINIMQVAVPAKSTINTIDDLRGRRVLVGTPGSGTETLARIVLESYALSYEDLRPEFKGFVETVAMMRDGEADAAFIGAGLPTAAIVELSAAADLRFIPIPREQVTMMRAQYPFLQPLLVPRGTYTWLAHDIETVGVSNLLLCRKDLDEELVYRLTRALFDALPELRASVAAVRLIDLEHAPATPIPLHPGAARYYREREITQ
ncbi:MAG: TAXI family TRAP transporter solute-binding subunit, partial [Vicinamibacterales bacterium]